VLVLWKITDLNLGALLGDSGILPRSDAPMHGFLNRTVTVGAHQALAIGSERSVATLSDEAA
jgi:hypothetical protein